MESDRGTGIWQTWEDYARCRGSNPAVFFPHTESDSGLEKVKKEFCDVCPVRVQCLARALVNGDSGYYGGTLTSQRRAMSRTRTRRRCPVCRTTSLVPAPPYQICTCCGTSWKADGTLAAPPVDEDHATGLVSLPHQISGTVVTVPDPGRLLS